MGPYAASPAYTPGDASLENFTKSRMAYLPFARVDDPTFFSSLGIRW